MREMSRLQEREFRGKKSSRDSGFRDCRYYRYRAWREISDETEIGNHELSTRKLSTCRRCKIHRKRKNEDNGS